MVLADSGRRWAVLPVVVLLMLLCGCARQPDDIIRFGLAAAPVNLDPRYASDATSTRINRLLYRRLVEFDEHLRPQPALASWEQPEPRRYRFHLDPQRAPFHDGKLLTARDVAATYRSILAADSASPHRGALRLIEAIEVLDDDTLDFRLAHPDPLFPAYLVIGILPARDIDAGRAFSTQPLGSGPFRLAGWPEPGRLRLTRLSDGQIMEFQRVGDPVVRVLKLLRGELDLLQNDLPAELVAYLERQQGIRVARTAGSNFAYVGFNISDPACSDLRVRRALAHAIDSAAIRRYVLGGAARPAASVLDARHWAGDPGLRAPGYDPELARGFLRQAGYSEQRPLQLTWKTSTDPVRLRIATIIQQQLTAVGIELTIGSYDWGTFFGDIRSGNFQVYSLMWVGIKTPDIFRYAFHSASLPPGGANRGRLADDRLDRLIEQAEQGDTLQEQAAGYRAVQARLLELLPYVPLWYEDHVLAMREDIVGYSLAADGNYDGLLQVRRHVAQQ